MNWGPVLRIYRIKKLGNDFLLDRGIQQMFKAARIEKFLAQQNPTAEASEIRAEAEAIAGVLDGSITLPVDEESRETLASIEKLLTCLQKVDKGIPDRRRRRKVPRKPKTAS